MKYANYIERERRGSPDFPIQYYYLDKESARYVMNAHWHGEFEFIRVISGSLTVYLDNVEHRLSAGDVLLVESGTLHRGVPADCVYECIVFQLNMLIKQPNDAAQKLISPLINSSVGINKILYSENDAIGADVMLLFETLRHKAPYHELTVYSLLFGVFSKLYDGGYISGTGKTEQPRQAKSIAILIDWIEKNITGTITLEKLSGLSGFSPKYLCRIFKEYTSKTPISYINELRIENACYEMSELGKSVTDAAFDSGFNDLSYFCKTFRQYKGITPKNYKRTHSTSKEKSEFLNDL